MPDPVYLFFTATSKRCILKKTKFDIYKTVQHCEIDTSDEVK